MRERLPIAILLIPFALWIIGTGGALYTLALIGIFTAATQEYLRLFQRGQYHPAGPLLIGGVAWLFVGAAWPALNPHNLAETIITLSALTWHLIDYERGATTSATDFVITIGGVFYLGGLGRYFILLRALPPDGLWWLATVLPGMWFADSGAYIMGRWLGRHKMSPRLSPKKTWEGFAGSVGIGAVGAALLAGLWHLSAGPQTLVTWQNGLLLGAGVGALGPLGDLGVSMLKRQIGVKDSSTLLEGHGGFLDRIDSWLVAVPLGYYCVLALQYLTG